MAWYRWQDTVLELRVYIQARARVNEVVGVRGDRLYVRVQAPPLDGKANRPVRDLLAQQFFVARQRVEIHRGRKSRTKTIRIDDPTVIPAVLVPLIQPPG